MAALLVNCPWWFSSELNSTFLGLWLCVFVFIGLHKHLCFALTLPSRMQLLLILKEINCMEGRALLTSFPCCQSTSKLPISFRRVREIKCAAPGQNLKEIPSDNDACVTTAQTKLSPSIILQMAADETKRNGFITDLRVLSMHERRVNKEFSFFLICYFGLVEKNPHNFALKAFFQTKPINRIMQIVWKCAPVTVWTAKTMGPLLYCL